MQTRVVFAPQSDFQVPFLSSSADVVLGGGSAGCGKTMGMLLAGARHIHVPDFGGVFFRVTMPEILRKGGLWDEARKIYPLLGGKANNGRHTYTWGSSASLEFAHLNGLDEAHSWHGGQVPLFLFDELTLIDEGAFWYMQSRNRSTCGVRPYVMATCNPDADSWVAKLVDWYIDGREYLKHKVTGDIVKNPRYGLPLRSRAGLLRYWTRVGDDIVWGNTREEVVAQRPDIPLQLVQSFTFIPGKLSDNKILESKDPSYRVKLMGMSRVQRARLLEGNWKIRAEAGDYFKRTEVKMLDEEPGDVVKWVRRWDLAATEPNEVNKDPDWTFGVKMGLRANGRIVVAHAIGVRKRAEEVRELVKKSAAVDGDMVKIGIPKDPGQAGKEQAESYARMLLGYLVYIDAESGPKEARAEPLAAAWQAGNVDVVRGAWNSLYFSQMEGFPSKDVHDDAVDASSGAFSYLTRSTSFYDLV